MNRQNNQRIYSHLIALLMVTILLICVISNFLNFKIVDHPVQPELISDNDHEQIEQIETPSKIENPDQSLTRSSARVQDNEPNDVPENATLVSRATLTSITGSISSGTDVDWFKMKLEVGETSGGKLDTVDTFNVTLIEISGDNNYNFGTFVYGIYDINQNGMIDFDTELIFMNCGIYRIGQSFQETLSIKSYISEYYYIKFVTDGGIADYNFRLNFRTDSDYDDTNQDIKYSTSLLTETTHQVYMANDTFDWLSEKKLIAKDAIGVNFSINVKINDYFNKPSVTINGVTYYFVTVLHMLVYHEGNLVAGKPVFPYQYRDHVQTTRSTQLKLPKEIIYSDVVTLPTHIFQYTYVGFYVESFCIVPSWPGQKFYPLIPELEEYVQNTFCTFTIEDKSISNINRPELQGVSVISLSSRTIFGKSYDTFKYTVTYLQEDNNRPFISKISIFTLTGEFIDDMRKVTLGTSAQNIWKTGCVFEYTISGLELGEGNHHVYQFHFKDKNAYANGTIELGKTWHGPYISNNIGPFVRPSAPENITLHEDDNTTLYNLNNIFEDADILDELNFSLADPNLEPAERSWITMISSPIVDVSIVNGSQLKIVPKPNKNGEISILLNASDRKSFFINYELKIIILPVNDPPQIIKYFTYVILNEDDVYSEMNMADHIVDIIDDEKLMYWSENNIHIDVIIDENNNVRLIPDSNWYGVEYIDLFGSDGKETVSDYLKVIVRSVNDPPLLFINDTIELWEDQWFNISIAGLDMADNETVIIGHNLTQIFPVLLKSPNSYGYSFNNLTGYLTFKPVNNMVGKYSWNISAMDNSKLVNFTHVTLIIYNVNDPPAVKIVYPTYGARFLTTDKISFRGLGTDVDTELKESYFTWYSVLNGTLNKIGAGQTLPPLLYQEGSYKIILSLTDGEYTANATISITIFSIMQNIDTDKDEIPDYWENLYFFNPHDPNDASFDMDRDTYSNWEEYKAGTDPLDQNSMPEKHITKKGEGGEEFDYIWIIWLIIVIIIILIVILFFFWQRTREKRKREEAEKLSTEGIIGMSVSSDGSRPGLGKFKTPKIICHSCGKSLEILTLNRPLVITCTDCGKRGVVYK